jgi:glucose-1-phosphate adenylyltransferase
VNSYALVEDSILFDNVQIGRKARVKKAIIDEGIVIPEGMEIGFDHEADRERGCMITDGGIVVVTK